MRADLILQVRQRYNFRCGYCGVSEVETGASLTIDHYQPRSQGGLDEQDNLFYACHTCNEIKSDFWQPDSLQRILHPLNDPISEHLVEEVDGTLRPLTETGQFHIRRLRLNRPQLIENRVERAWRNSARQREAELLARLMRVEQLVQELLEQMTGDDNGVNE